MNILNCFLDNRLGGPQKRAHIIAKRIKDDSITTVMLFNAKDGMDPPFTDFNWFVIPNLQVITRENTLMNFVMFWLFFPFNIFRVCRIIKKELSWTLKRYIRIYLLEKHGLPRWLAPVFIPPGQNIHPCNSDRVDSRIFLCFHNQYGLKLSLISDITKARLGRTMLRL